MQEQELNEAQKAALPGLKKRAFRANLAIEAKTFFLLVGSIVITLAANELYVHSMWFVGIMAFTNGIMGSNYSRAAKKEAIAKLAKELSEIK